MVSLAVLLCAAALAAVIFWRNEETPEPSAAPSPAPTAAEAQPTEQPVAETPEAAAEPEETPAIAETETPAETGNWDNEAVCEELFARFQALGEDYVYVKFFPRRGAGVFAEQGANFTIGLPEGYAERPMNLIFYFDPGFFPVYGAYGYHHAEEINYFYQEDDVDMLMDANPDTVVVTVSANLNVKMMMYMLRCLDAIGIGEVDKVICSGWSAGCNYALTCEALILQHYPQLGTPCLVLTDTNHSPNVDENIYDTLAGSGAKCLVFSSMDHAVQEHHLYHLTACGLPIAVIRADMTLTGEYNTHIQRRILAITDNLYGYVLGNQTELPGGLYEASYRYGYHDYEKNDTVWSTAQDVYDMFFADWES